MNKLDHKEHKTFGDSERITYKKLTIERPLSPRAKTTINLNRKHSTVLEKIHQLFEIMWNLDYRKMISHNDMVFMICKYCGSNRGTVRAYLGHISYGGSSKYGNKHVMNVTKGFLEQFGYAKRYRGNWILFHKNIPRSYHYVENLPISLLEDMNGSEGNMEKISLSQSNQSNIHQILINGETKGNIRKKEEEDTAREINFQAKKHIEAYPKHILTSQEERMFQNLMNAKPFEHGEPDKAKMKSLNKLR